MKFISVSELMVLYIRLVHMLRTVHLVNSMVTKLLQVKGVSPICICVCKLTRFLIITLIINLQQFIENYLVTL